jgi:hypothetical protein
MAIEPWLGDLLGYRQIQVGATGDVQLPARARLRLSRGFVAVDDAIAGVTDLSADTARVINAQTGTSYTLALADAAAVLALANASAITLTVPPHSVVPLPVGVTIPVYQDGAGQFTVAAGVGVSLLSAATPPLRSAARYASPVVLFQRAIDTWIVSGGLA